MPKVGTLVRAQLRNGFLLKFGNQYPNICNLPEKVHTQGASGAPLDIPNPEIYTGIIIGIWQVPANEHEPAQIDALAVPAPVFQAFASIGRGANPENVLAQLQRDAAAAHANKQAAPSAMRVSFLLEEGPCAFYEASLSMPEALEHYLDRNAIAQSAYEESEEDDEEEEAAADAAAPPAPVVPLPVPAMLAYATAQTGG